MSSSVAPVVVLTMVRLSTNALSTAAVAGVGVVPGHVDGIARLDGRRRDRQALHLEIGIRDDRKGMAAVRRAAEVSRRVKGRQDRVCARRRACWQRVAGAGSAIADIDRDGAADERRPIEYRKGLGSLVDHSRWAGDRRVERDRRLPERGGGAGGRGRGPRGTDQESLTTIGIAEEIGGSVEDRLNDVGARRSARGQRVGRTGGSRTDVNGDGTADGSRSIENCERLRPLDRPLRPGL